MEPVTLVLTALATGAALGVKDTVSQAVMDTYEGLKALVRNRLTGRRDGEIVLARFEEAPDIWRDPLSAELTAAGADTDADVLAAAQALMTMVDAAGSRAGHTVHVHGGQGVQVGTGDQVNNFAGDGATQIICTYKQLTWTDGVTPPPLVGVS